MLIKIEAEYCEFLYNQVKNWLNISKPVYVPKIVYSEYNIVNLKWKISNEKNGSIYIDDNLFPVSLQRDK